VAVLRAIVSTLTYTVFLPLFYLICGGWQTVHSVGEFRKNKGCFICCACGIFFMYMIYYLIPHQKNAEIYITMSVTLLSCWAGLCYVYAKKFKNN